MQPLERFLAKIAIEPESGCWLWTGGQNPNGYGTFRVDGHTIGAHRWGYEQLVGPIPAGLELDHVKARGCVHRHCVNPDHLEPVTHRANIRRGGNAIKLICPQGHAYNEENTRVWGGRRYCRACHNEVSRAHKARRRAA